MTTTYVPNPFFVGGPVPPDRFVGRTIELNTAFDQIMNRGHMAISGSPGMGKSSFLHLIADHSTWQQRGLDFSTVVVVSLNCTDINPFTPAAFWHEIVSLLRDQLEDHDPIQQTIDQIFQEEDGIETRDLRRVLRQIGEQGKFLLLLLDDYGAALVTNKNNYDEQDMLVFLREFRNLSIHSKEGQYLSTVVVTFRRLSELGPALPPGGSPWYNHYLFQTLKLFTDNDVHTLFSGMPDELSLTDEQQEAILSVAGRHPALLQHACYLLFQSVQSGQTAFDPHQFIDNFVGSTEHIFRDIWRFSTEDEQMLLMLIALSDMDGRLHKNRYTLNDLNLILSQRERQLDDLRDRGAILHQIRDGVSHYSFASSMMGWWVIKEIENSTREELEQREKVFFNLSRKQIEQAQNILQWVRESKEAAVHIAEWTGKLVGAFAKGFGVR